ncbi:TIGR01777 family oxidoreductase [Flavobacterium sp.]|uniref:TIGR01777 family oxidoreductase n=1 Tax=Flavobacterium sp. TaxID=239 RepID=UPI00262B9D25|nr:TIGR01777 family oxidoreductase [Flavobacterium sp.]
MRILITGGSGLIGHALTKHLVQKGHHVHWLTTQKSPKNVPVGVQTFYWNPAEGKIDDQCWNGVDALVHLAGATIAKRWTPHYKTILLESRVVSANVLYASLKKLPQHQVKHILSASGTAIYPDDSQAVYTEHSQIQSNTFLGTLVQRWETAVDQFSKLDLTVTKVRTGVVYAREGGALQPIVQPIRWGMGAIFGSGKQMQSWIHLHDIVQLYAWLLEKGHAGVFNGVAPHAVSNKEQTKIIARLLKRPIWLPPVPRWVMRLVLGDMHELLFNDKKILPQRALDLGFTFTYPNAEKAFNDLLP